MIGLGSNRLSVCRRGGMRVTQAGRGGMEWLAGGRRPSWVSPYSAQATAALKAAYPDLWTTLQDFGFRNPDKVPFINQYPLVAPYLLADGLAFMVDCQYECSAALWKDLIGAVEFAGTNVQIQSGVPYFDGTAGFASTDKTFYNINQCTFELVFKSNILTSGMIFQDGSTGNAVTFAASYRDSTNHIIPTSQAGGYTHRMFPFNKNTVLNSISFIIDEMMCVNNGSAVGPDTSVYNGWNKTSDWFKKIGTGGNSSSMFFQGNIYAVRIYNRKLSLEEMKANQAIDLQRWQPS